MSEMKIAVIGPGSVGLLLSGLFYKNGIDVTLVDHMPGRTDKLNKEGIRWEGLNEEQNYKIKVICGFDASLNFDLAIVCVKAYDTETVAMALGEAGYKGPVLTLQNGLGNVEALKKHLPGSPILAGITSEGANIVEDGHVRHAGRGKTLFGRVYPDKPEDKFMDDLLKVLKKSELESEIVSDVDSTIWSKLLVNVGINALTAILNVQNGKLVEIAHARELMSKIVLEGWEFTKKNGLKLPYSDPIEKVEEVCRMTAQNFSSMNQDIKYGRKTEIDFINGAIVKAGKKIGFECPYNEFITGLIHAIENKS